MWRDEPGPGRFRVLYHGTRAVLVPGDAVEPGELGHASNYPPDELSGERGQHAYATPVRARAWKFARQAEQPGVPRVYRVEPLGPLDWDEEAQPEDFESDEAMERRGSRRCRDGFRVIAEVQGGRHWARMHPAQYAHAPGAVRASTGT